MSDYDREPPLTFDARRSSGPPERPRSGGLLLISAVILVALVIAFAVFAVSQMGGGAEDEPTTIETMKAPAEGAATPAQTPVPTGLPVETVATLPPGGSPTFAPTPEQPGARPTAPVPPPAAPTAVAPSGPVAAQPVTAPKAAAPKPDPIGDKIAATMSKAAPAPTPVATKTAGPQNGASSVQIGAYGSQAIAEREWNAVALALPAEMVGKLRVVEPVQVNGETRYRAIISGFSSRAQADAFCARLKGQGRDCFARN